MCLFNYKNKIKMILRKMIESVFRRLQFVFFLHTYLKKFTNHQAWTRIFVQIFATIFISTIQISILFSIEIFRQFLKVFLYIFVTDFDGLLKGRDSVWAKVSDKESKCSPAVLVFIEHENPKELQQEIKQRYMDIFDTGLYQRTFNKIDSFCGFFYYLKSGKINVDEHVVDLDLYDSKDSFEESLSKIINEDFPEDDKSTWKVYVGQQKIEWLNKSTNIYPVLYRMHHSMGDGISLLNLFVDIFVDDGNDIIKKIYNDMNKKILKRNSDSPPKSEVRTIKKIYEKISSLQFKSIKLTPPLRNEHFLYGQKLSGVKSVSFLSEDKPNLVEKVKRIKKKLNVSFTDVVNAAICASFAEYFENHCKNSKKHIPEFLSTTMVVMLGVMDLAKEVSTVKGRLKVKLNNKFTSGNLQFPIKKFLDNQKKNFQPHIMDLNNESVKLQNSIDLAYNEWQLNIPTPSPITRYILSCSLGALIISSLPGCGRLTVLNGRPVHDMTFWIPNMLLSGIGVSIQTYDDRFQIGLLADEVLIGDKRDLQKILDGVFKYMGLFYEEIMGVDDYKGWNVMKYDIV